MSKQKQGQEILNTLPIEVDRVEIVQVSKLMNVNTGL